ncbi:MAG: polysaccharide deacetylase family protein [Gemmatimonadota bacterium]
MKTLAILGATVVLLATPSTAWSQSSRTDRRVALTFDDIPLGQGQPGTRCDADKLLAVSRRITEALVANSAPSAAFITTGNVCDEIRDPVLGQVIRIWAQAGAVIGNHGHRHLSLSRTPIDIYQADLIHADSLIRQLGGHKPRYFRHPFLHAGADTGTMHAMDRWLEEQHYTVGIVTVDNNEWVYARAYTMALGRGDSTMMRRLVSAYLEHMDKAFAFAESMSVRVIGEEIPQIVLLHANEINRDHIGKVLSVIKARGYSFISLDEALADPVYQRPTYYVGPWGISWILRWSSDSTVWRMDLPKTEEWVEQ